MSLDFLQPRTDERLSDPTALRMHIQRALQTGTHGQPLWDDGHPIDNSLSVVFFLIGVCRTAPDRPPEPCVILNKRSSKVRQPGDICCPGGGIAPRFDHFTARLLRLPLAPLRQWGYYRFWQQRAPQSIPRLSLLLATALREGFEEMRMNPLGVHFQGMLPPEQLVMFKRMIYPLVGWVRRQRHFFPNWEVERIVRIPIRDLLNPAGYIGLRLKMTRRGATGGGEEFKEFPAFRYQSPAGTEILWGATYRITMNFLDRVFSFVPPDTGRGSAVEKRLTENYLTGKG